MRYQLSIQKLWLDRTPCQPEDRPISETLIVRSRHWGNDLRNRVRLFKCLQRSCPQYNSSDHRNSQRSQPTFRKKPSPPCLSTVQLPKAIHNQTAFNSHRTPKWSNHQPAAAAPTPACVPRKQPVPAASNRR